MNAAGQVAHQRSGRRAVRGLQLCGTSYPASVVLFPLLTVRATYGLNRFIHSSPSTGQLLAGGSSKQCAEISRECSRSNAALRHHILQKLPTGSSSSRWHCSRLTARWGLVRPACSRQADFLLLSAWLKWLHIFTINPLKPTGHSMYRTVVTIYTTSLTFNNSTFCPHSCIYVFCVDLRTNSDYFPIQH